MDEATNILIDQYLSGDLSEEALQAFEQRMANEKTLAQEVAFQRDIRSAFLEPNIEDLEQKLSQIIEQERDASVRPIAVRRWWTVAASVILLAGVGFLLYQLFQPAPGPEELYFAYAIPPESLLLPNSMRSLQQTGEADSLSKWVERVDLLYQEGKAEEALDQLKQTALKYPALATAYPSIYHFLQGMLLIELKQWDAARIELEQVRSGDYAEPADWFGTLLELRLTGNTDSVRDRLDGFLSYPNPYKEAAAELRKELE